MGIIFSRKSPRRDLNSRPLVYKTSALTTELRRRDIVRTKLVHYSDILECHWGNARIVRFLSAHNIVPIHRVLQ